MSSATQLNLLQRGFLQKILAYLVYMLCLLGAGYVVDWLQKQQVIQGAGQLYKQGAIDLETFRQFQQLIESINANNIFSTFLAVIISLTISYFLVRLTSKLNLSWPVTLIEAREFTSVMRTLGVTDPGEQIALVHKHKIPIYIATAPILDEKQSNLRARLYPFAHKPLLTAADVFARNIGQRTLCLDGYDYQRLMEQSRQNLSLAESAVLAEKDRELQALKATLTSIMADKVQLETEMMGLQSELRGFKNQAQMKPAQEEERVRRLRIERLQWAAFIPATDRLMKQADKGQKYTTKELQTAFDQEWQQRADLRKRMHRLTGSENTTPSEPVIKAIKADFKEAGLFSEGGRPRKNS